MGRAHVARGPPDAHDRQDAYPCSGRRPTMTRWNPISPTLYSFDERLEGTCIRRSLALVLPDGGTLVVSPNVLTPEAGHASLAALGQPTILAAPNQYHNAGLRPFSTRYPGATCVSTPDARTRLAKRTGLAFSDLAYLRERLPRHVEVLEPPGMRNGEFFLRVADPGGVTWVVGDAFFNYPVFPPGWFGWFLDWTKGGTGLAIGNSFLYIGLRERPAYVQWLLLQLAADNPTTLVPLHGEPLHSPDLPAAIETIVRSRVK